MIVSDQEWHLFIDNNIVDNKLIKLIGLRMMNQMTQTDREIAIYKEYSEEIEMFIRDL